MQSALAKALELILTADAELCSDFAGYSKNEI